ncbi:MAG: GtrA family protein [Clostridia bacterium]|nr:GtrA family protein [Clostridia bacterium]
MNKLKTLIKSLLNRETVTYVVFGVLTTLVNLVVFKGFDLLFSGHLYLLSNVFAWVAAVTFAFVTNKCYVFESTSWKAAVLKKEIPGFVGARIGSLLIEEGGLWFFVEVLGFGSNVFDFIVVRLSGKIVAKLILGVIVVVVNYLLSKFLIFRQGNAREGE